MWATCSKRFGQHLSIVKRFSGCTASKNPKKRLKSRFFDAAQPLKIFTMDKSWPNLFEHVAHISDYNISNLESIRVKIRRVVAVLVNPMPEILVIFTIHFPLFAILTTFTFLSVVKKLLVAW